LVGDTLLDKHVANFYPKKLWGRFVSAQIKLHKMVRISY